MTARKRKKKNAIFDDLANRVTAKRKDVKIVMNPDGEISMSDAISQLIEPYQDDVYDYETSRKLVTFACVAWNASILPKEMRDEMIGRLLNSVASNDKHRHGLLDLITALMARKRNLFPDISRMILDFKVTDLGNDFHIAIASTMENKESAK
jgi:hypothetical protein